MFDHLLFYPFAVTGVFMGAKVFVCPHIFDIAIMHEVVKGKVFDFVVLGRTKNWTVLCVLHQDYFWSVAMYKTRMPHANVMKKFRWEGIQLCAIFG